MTTDGFEKTQTLIKKGKDRNLEILEDGEFREYVHDLEGATNSLLYPSMGREMSYLFIIKKDLARIRQYISGQEVDHCRFACTVWANDRCEHSFINLEINVVCGADHTEIFSEFFCPEEVCHPAAPNFSKISSPLGGEG
jgi:hypothetical protein